MSRNASGFVTMCCLAAIGRVAPCVAAGSDPDPIVMIKVENPNGLDTPGLDRAQQLATGIFERAGVALRWTPDETTELRHDAHHCADDQYVNAASHRQRRHGRRPQPRGRHARDAGVCLSRQGPVLRGLASPERRARARVRPGA